MSNGVVTPERIAFWYAAQSGGSIIHSPVSILINPEALKSNNFEGDENVYF